MIKLIDLLEAKKYSPFKQLSKTINIKVDLALTGHGEERLFRHIDNPLPKDEFKGEVIEKEDITDLVNKALPSITNDLIMNELDVYNKVCIKDKKTFLNVVGVLEPDPEDENKLDFNVVTVMYHRKFFETARKTYII